MRSSVQFVLRIERLIVEGLGKVSDYHFEDKSEYHIVSGEPGSGLCLGYSVSLCARLLRAA